MLGILNRAALTLDHSLITGAILETNRITNLIAEIYFHLLADTLCDTHGSNTSRLGTANHAEL
jgi:hypothetical protein